MFLGLFISLVILCPEWLLFTQDPIDSFFYSAIYLNITTIILQVTIFKKHVRILLEFFLIIYTFLRFFLRF